MTFNILYNILLFALIDRFLSIQSTAKCQSANIHH